MGKPIAGPGTAVRAADGPRKKHVKITPRQRSEGQEGPVDKHWRTYFLQKLAETSNVTASADHAGISPSRAYKARREDPNFNAAWRAALLEGYDHLEMEVLGYLRNPGPDHKMDVASALRLLASHRETAQRERAARDSEDEQAVLQSIDQFIEDMRQRRAANAPILLEMQARDGAQ